MLRGASPIKAKSMPSQVFLKTWGQVAKPEVQVAKPTLAVKEAKATATQVEVVEVDPIVQKEEYVMQPVNSVAKTAPKGFPAWLVIAFGSAAGLFLLWALAASWQAKVAYQSHSRILEKLLMLSVPSIKTAPRESLEKLIAELSS